MSMDVPSAGQSSRPLKVTVTPAPGTVVLGNADPLTAAVQVPVARVPVSELLKQSVEIPSVAPATSASSVEAAVRSDQATCSDEPTMANEQTAGAVKAAPASSSPDTTALPDDPAVLKQMIAELLRALRQERRGREEIQARLDALLRRLYGPRPDPANPDQPTLFPEDDVPAPPPPPAPPPTDDERTSKRGQSKPHGRQRPARNLRREEKRYELTAAERLCPDCGHEREQIGVEITEQYEYKPAEIFVIEHQQVKYACKCCEAQVALAAKPPQFIEKGLPGPGLLAVIITDKYHDHLPLHRTENRIARMGVSLPRSTMSDWMAACAERLMPLWQLLKAHVLRSKVLHTDDTTVPVRDESRSKHRYGRLWDYIGDIEHPGVVFDYTTTHARDGPAAFLKGFQGFLQADAYGGYDGIYTGSDGKIVEVGCWAHGRNKFKEAQSTDPERVLVVKAWIRKLYDVEDEAKEFSSAERLRLRQEKSVPLLESFHKWLLAQKPLVLPKSPIAAAINYVLNQWEALKRYTTDGDLHIDNNISERTLKLIGVGRLNWLFLGSDNGGRTAAVLFSFTATCKHLDIDPFAYLRDVFERLPTHPTDRLEELLPHRWLAARQTSTAPASDSESKPT
jgi:transposase